MQKDQKNSRLLSRSIVWATAIILTVMSLALTVPAGLAKTLAEEDVTRENSTGAGSSGSPYFFINSDDPETDRIPLTSTKVDVNIAGVIAQVQVCQTYKNEGNRPLEAIYIFPASTRAAVHGLTMTIGERTIVAEIKKRGEARQDYEQAKQNGQSATLLEQQRPNVFQMNVANILPGDVIEVMLDYTELLVPDDAVYEFVYPTVVGPRYTGGSAGQDTGDNWAANPYLHEGQAPPSTFDLTANIRAGLPIQEISCPSHRTNINYTGKNQAAIELDTTEQNGGNRDYILKYRLAGGKVETGLLLFEGEKENFFLMMMQPPKTIKEDIIPPRDYLFIFDVSGSMHGFPLDISKELFRNLAKSLRPADRFNVLLFAGGNQFMAPQSLPATAANIKAAINLVDNQRGGGGTQLLPAMQRSLAMPGTEGYSRSIVVVTDGYVTVEKEAFDLIRDNLGQANLFAFGIGSSVNRHLIEGMTRVGQGRPFIVTHPDNAAAQAEKLRQLIASPVLTNIAVDYGKFDVYDVEPPSVPDVMGDRPVIVFGKYHGNPRGHITVTGDTGEGHYRSTVKVDPKAVSDQNAALRYLWARQRIAVLSDYNKLSPDDERVQEVTTLGLTYNLLTNYTSFIAVDKQKRAQDGRPVTVKQPLPLPQGVSNYAVGGASPMAAKCYRQAAPGPVRTLADCLTGGLRKQEVLVEEAAVEEEKDKAQVQSHLVIKKVKINGGASEDAIRRIATSHLTSIEQCLTGIKNLPKTITVTLSVNAKGEIIKIKANRVTRKNKTLMACLDQTLKTMALPAAKHKPYTVKIVFTMR